MSAAPWHWVVGKHAIFYTRTTMSKNIVARAEIIATETGPSHKLKFHITFAGPGGKLECLTGWGRSPTREGLAKAKIRAVEMVSDHVELIRSGKLDDPKKARGELEKLMEKYGERYHFKVDKRTGRVTEVTVPTVDKVKS